MSVIKLESSKDTFLRNTPCLIMGAPGVGKTFAAATFSNKFPAKLPAESPTELDDMLWVLSDSGGLDGFAEQGITAPVIDLSTVALKDYKTALGEVPAMVEKLCKERSLRAVVIDTVTGINNSLVTSLGSSYEGWDLWRIAQAEQMKFMAKMKAMPVVLFLLFHQKVIVVNPGKTEEAVRGKLDAAGLTEGSTTIDIQGSGMLNVYRGNSSLLLPMKKIKAMNGTIERVVLPSAHGSDAKTRFACLGAREPAHMGQLFDKVRASSRV